MHLNSAAGGKYFDICENQLDPSLFYLFMNKGVVFIVNLFIYCNYKHLIITSNLCDILNS